MVIEALLRFSLPKGNTAAVVSGMVTSAVAALGSGLLGDWTVPSVFTTTAHAPGEEVAEGGRMSVPLAAETLRRAGTGVKSANLHPEVHEIL